MRQKNNFQRKVQIDWKINFRTSTTMKDDSIKNYFSTSTVHVVIKWSTCRAYWKSDLTSKYDGNRSGKIVDWDPKDDPNGKVLSPCVSYNYRYYRMPHIDEWYRYWLRRWLVRSNLKVLRITCRIERTWCCSYKMTALHLLQFTFAKKVTLLVIHSAPTFPDHVRRMHQNHG